MGEQSAESTHTDFALGHLARNQQIDKGAVRCGLADAAHMVDAVARDIAKGRRDSRELRAVLAALKRGADAVWGLRNKVVP